MPGLTHGMSAPRIFKSKCKSPSAQRRKRGGAVVPVTAFEHPDLDLNHVEPAGVLGRVVELKPPKHAARLCRWEGGVESGSGVG